MKQTFLSPKISIKDLRDYILDNGITDNDTILINTLDFDNLVLEHREYYKESIPIPYLLLGVLIREDESGSIPKSFISVIEDDIESLREPYQEETKFRWSNLQMWMVW